jgi:hypothetical protein
MQPLDKILRNQLERAVKNARDIAEKGAHAALGQLGVADPAAAAHLSDADRELRRRLRAHGRQLGDSLNGGKVQSMDRLVEEVAYEHWHRMLFARFLAENNLLMYPDPDEPVAITLEECDDLAADEGAANGWELAARYAAQMLPQIFRLDSPVFQLTLPPEHQQALERLVSGLKQETFTASDSLGWVYQFWQANNKERINKSEVKIGARELPAVTQLFTESYMVSFLLDNSLGAWWAARRLTEDDLKNTQSEEELRQKAAIPGVPLEYLRFVKVPPIPAGEGGDEIWTPASGTFDAWPENLADLKTLDPCCGSGHFLVAALLMLVPMRIERDDLSARDAVDAVLRENIHGLELDQRCVELAAFALALTAWNYPSAGGYRPLPELQLACTGLSVSVAKEEWKQLGLGKHNLTIALDWMHDTFKDAPVLGSLLNPAKSDAAKLVKWDELSATLNQALETEKSKQDESQQEAAVVAQGLGKAAMLLSGQYQWVVTNVPYLSRGKQNDRLQNYCERHYPEAKNDLATVFLDRCLELCTLGGTSSVVLPQNWLFLTSYKKFREKLLNNDTWHLIARLGPQGFQTPMYDFNVQLITISRGNHAQPTGGLFGEAEQTNQIRGVDVSESRSAAEKAGNLLIADIKSVHQVKQLENPDSLISLEASNSITLLNEYADGLAGILNGDSPRFLKVFWEIRNRKDLWSFQQTTQKESSNFGGLHNLVYYDETNGHLREERWIRRSRLHDSDQRGQSVVGKKGVAVSSMGSLPASFFLGSRFDSNVATVVPKSADDLAALWCFCSSEQYNEAVRQIDQSLKVTNATLVKVL